MLDWLVDLLGAARSTSAADGPGGGVIQMSASDSTHLVHVVARERGHARRRRRATDWSPTAPRRRTPRWRGARASPASAHVRALDVDDAFALRPGRARAAIAADRAARPRARSSRSAIGTTSPRAVDPVARDRATIAPRTRRSGCTSTPRGRARRCVCPEHRSLQRRASSGADSYAFNPHKWLFTNFDCDVLLGRRPRGADRGAVDPARVPAQRGDASRGAVIDYRDWHVPLGPALPGAEAVVRAAQLRRRGPARTTPRARRAGAPSSAARVDAHPRAGARRAGAVRARLLPPRATATTRPTRSPTAINADRRCTSRRRRSATRASSASRRPDAHVRGRRRAPVARDRVRRVS